MKKYFNLQLFAEGELSPNTDPNQETSGGKPGEETKGAKGEKKYSDEEVDQIVKQRLARERKDHQKALEDAKKTATMDAQQKAEYERDQMKQELEEYKRKDALAEASRLARKTLSEKGISISDDLLAVIVTTNEEANKKAIDSFAAMYQRSVEAAVKEMVRGETPRQGTGSGAAISEIDKRIQKYS